jgi:hypothetical protein
MFSFCSGGGSWVAQQQSNGRMQPGIQLRAAQKLAPAVTIATLSGSLSAFVERRVIRLKWDLI